MRKTIAGGLMKVAEHRTGPSIDHIDALCASPAANPFDPRYLTDANGICTGR
jgi:hypothetical protein